MSSMFRDGGMSHTLLVSSQSHTLTISIAFCRFFLASFYTKYDPSHFTVS